MSVSVEIQGADGVRNVLTGLPSVLADGMNAALRRSLQRYKAYHSQQRLQKPPPPVWRGRSGPKGVHATRKPGIGLLGAWSINVHGRALTDMYGKLWTSHMIAKEFETGQFHTTAKSGWAPLPPARDRYGRTLKKYSALRAAKKLIVVKRRDGKKFLVMENKAFKRHRGQARRQGFTLRAHQGQRYTFLFHQVKHRIIQPRLDFVGLWGPWLDKEGREIFWKAFRGATNAAQRRLGGGA